MQFSRDAGPKGELNYINHTTGMKLHAHTINVLEVGGDKEGNKPSTLYWALVSGPCTVRNLPEYEE